MSIPAIDGIEHHLPPHSGDPRIRRQCSPYQCTINELFDAFATTDHRRRILRGFLDLRERLVNLGVTGFQWVGGSFVEGVEARLERNPRDIDVVTFARTPETSGEVMRILEANKDLLYPAHLKEYYWADHFLVPLGSTPDGLVDHARFWSGLLSHRSDDQRWKGFLRIELEDLSEDAELRATL